jgi:2-succinyl-6-hydroxy-2,4-cyclohexadiene-1-carboxylate synthase
MLYLHGFAGHPTEAEGLFSGPTRSAGVVLPGHGPSGGKDSCSMASAVERVCAHVAAQGDEQVDLMGYSMGARVALSVAAQHPEWLRRLVLIGAHPGLKGSEKQQRSTIDTQRAADLEALGLDRFMDLWEKQPVLNYQARLTPALRAQMKKNRRSHTVAGLGASLREMGTGAMPALWESLPQLKVPVLWVTGAQDSQFKALAERAHGKTPRSTLLSISGAGHCAHLENHKAFQKALRDFLAT